MGIGTRLKQWTKLLESHTARWRRIQHPETGRDCDGIIFIGHVDVSAALRDRDHDQLRRVRELIDLLRLLAAADQVQFAQLMNKLTEQWCGFDNESEIVDAIQRRVPLTLKFELRSNGVSDFTPRLSGLFSNPFARDNADFIRERRRLVKVLGESQWAKLQSRSTPVSLYYSSRGSANLLCVDTEDLFVDLARFAAQAKQNIETLKLDQWGSLLPIALEKISLRLNPVWMTPRILHKTMDLIATGVPVKLKEITIDPRFVQCSQDDLHCFLKALTQVKSKLRVNVGQSGLREDINILDRRGHDRSELLRVIFHAVNSLATLYMLSVSKLLQMIVSPRNRRLVFQELLIPVLARPTPIAHFSCSPASLTSPDSECIRMAAQEWRQANPGK